MTKLVPDRCFPDLTDTQAFAAAFADVLEEGDTLLLHGQIGAGKSAFARALIQTRLGKAEDVPSPTFTLVQTYDDGRAEIWHCDLYRLTDPLEVIELGLEEAFGNAICLIEWPDRLGDLAPAGSLNLYFAATPAGHTITVEGPPEWQKKLGGLYA